MQRAHSDLENLIPLWQRELAHLIHQPKIKGSLRRNVDVLSAAGGQSVIGDSRPLAQDALRSEVVRQGAVKGALK